MEQPLLDELVKTAYPIPMHDQIDLTKAGVNALLAQLQESENTPERIDRFVIDECITQIDRHLSEQVDEIMHHKDFQKTESAWRNLEYLVKQTNFRENIKIDCLDVSQAELAEDFSDAPELSKSTLYHWVYSTEYAQFGGEPYAAMIANMAFSHRASDLQLLKNMAGVAGMAHAPLIASTSPEFFGIQSITDLPQLKDMDALFESPAYAAWHSFRQTEGARYVGLTIPRFLLRRPYDPVQAPIRAFAYEEKIEDHEHYCWGNASFALAARMADSFAHYRWCPNIIGPSSGGTVNQLPLHYFEAMGELEPQIPTEVLISDRREIELAEQGFIPLSFRKGSDNAAFFSANSAQKPKYFALTEQGNSDALNNKLGTQLPYLFIVSRIAHYLKVLQREQLGSWKESSDLEKELNTWINQYVANQDHAPPEIRSRKPLRQAKIDVSEIEAEPGWYQVNIQVRPHFKYMGSDITLSLTGKFESREQRA